MFCISNAVDTYGIGPVTLWPSVIVINEYKIATMYQMSHKTVQHLYDAFTDSMTTENHALHEDNYSVPKHPSF